jgi:hypothetical protein
MTGQAGRFKKKARQLYVRAVKMVLPTGMALRWELSRHYKLYERLARAAEAKGKFNEARDLRDEAWATARPEELELEWWETRVWRRRARRYWVQLPPYPHHEEDNEWWERDGLNHLVLTETGKSVIRKGMREELDWRRARWTAWANIGIGALAALAALLGGYFGARAGR